MARTREVLIPGLDPGTQWRESLDGRVKPGHEGGRGKRSGEPGSSFGLRPRIGLRPSGMTV